MKLTAGDWAEIFRAGDYGAKGSYTGADLDAMVANFNSADQVPIVVGHPATDAPAWGWLSAVKRAGDVLMGQVGELHKDFAAALAENKFRNRSVRIARTAAGPKLLHLGFLGAVLPQVEGLKTAAFAGEGELTDYAFDLPQRNGQEGNPKEGDMEKDEKIKQLEADLAAEKKARADEKAKTQEEAKKTRTAAFSAFVENEMVAKGKITKDRKDEVVGFMSSLPESSADFSVEADGATKTYNPVEWFKDFVKSLPAAEFTQELPPGETRDFSRSGKKEKLVDLSNKV